MVQVAKHPLYLGCESIDTQMSAIGYMMSLKTKFSQAEEIVLQSRSMGKENFAEGK